jgi:hypothetical protein
MLTMLTCHYMVADEPADAAASAMEIEPAEPAADESVAQGMT